MISVHILVTNSLLFNKWLEMQYGCQSRPMISATNIAVALSTILGQLILINLLKQISANLCRSSWKILMVTVYVFVYDVSSGLFSQCWLWKIVLSPRTYSGFGVSFHSNPFAIIHFLVSLIGGATALIAFVYSCFTYHLRHVTMKPVLRLSIWYIAVNCEIVLMARWLPVDSIY